MKHAAAIVGFFGILLIATAAHADDKPPAGEGILITVTQYKVDQTGKPKALLQVAHYSVVGDSVTMDARDPRVIIPAPGAPQRAGLIGTLIECQTRSAEDNEVLLDLKISRSEVIENDQKISIDSYTILEKRSLKPGESFSLDKLQPDLRHDLYVIKIEEFTPDEPE